MGIAGPSGSGYLPGPQPQSEKPPTWKVGGATILTFVALLYVIELLDILSGHRLDRHGIRPLEVDGLWGILFAPLLHADWGHLIANTVPALVLGFLVTMTGMSRFVWATAIVWILGGFGTWLTRHVWQIVASLVVFFVYGGILWGAMPILNQCGGVSWQGHLCGAIAGVVAAYWLSAPERGARQRRKLGPA